MPCCPDWKAKPVTPPVAGKENGTREIFATPMRRQGSLIAMTPLPSPVPKGPEGGQASTSATEQADVVYCPVGIKPPATDGEHRYRCCGRIGFQGRAVRLPSSCHEWSSHCDAGGEQSGKAAVSPQQQQRRPALPSWQKELQSTPRMAFSASARAWRWGRQQAP